MPPDDENDPRRPLEGTTTDPMFPPRLGSDGPAPVSVTAVQGPGAGKPKARETSTERLLTGLLQSEKNDSYLYRTKVKESDGEDSAAYNASPRPAPVGHEAENETPVIVAGMGAGASNARRDPDETAAIRPRRSDKWVAFLVAMLVVGVAGIFLLSWRSANEVEPPVGTWPSAVKPRTTEIPPPDPTLANPGVPTGAPIEVASDPIIESQQMPRPSAAKIPAVRVTGPTTSPTGPASATTPAVTAAVRPPPPDFDELKKGINH